MLQRKAVANIRGLMKKRGGHGGQAEAAGLNMRELARIAGVSASTVSRALRDHPLTPRVECMRIQSLAREHGYKAHPLFSAMLAAVRQRRRPAFQGKVAYLETEPVRAAFDRFPRFRAYYEGARRRAADFGYTMERHWLHELGISPSRLADMLEARGVQGLVICHRPDWRVDAPEQRVDFPFERFACALLGAPIAGVTLHSAREDTFHNAMLALRRLAEQGYRRVGTVLHADQNRLHDRQLEAAFALHIADCPRTNRVPMLWCRGAGFEGFATWLKRHKPDVVLGHYEDVFPELKRLGVKVPRDVGCASLLEVETFEGLAGVDRRCEQVAASAMELVLMQLRRGERGAPAVPKRVLIEGAWVEGRTLRRITESATRRKTPALPRVG